MGLFSKRNREPVVHPPVARTVHLLAPAGNAIEHLGEYSRLFSPKRADQHELRVATAGDWTAIRLPDAVHPWQLHNLAYWMLDCPGVPDHPTAVIAESDASPDHPGYRLVRDPELPDALCGWDDDMQGWTVHVPGNDIVRPEDVPVPRAVAVPPSHHDWQSVTVLLDDPGHDMNPRNESTFPSRKRLRDRNASLTF